MQGRVFVQFHIPVLKTRLDLQQRKIIRSQIYILGRLYKAIILLYMWVESSVFKNAINLLKIPERFPKLRPQK